MPAAMAAAEPPEEPPGARPASHGLRVFLKADVSVDEPMANSSMLVLPSTGTPASFSRRTTVASYGGVQFSRTRLPAVVRTPSVTMLSLRPPGTPASGCTASPRARASSADLAAASAWSAVTVKYAPTWGSSCSMRRSTCSVTSALLTSLAASRCRSSRTVKSCNSKETASQLSGSAPARGAPGRCAFPLRPGGASLLDDARHLHEAVLHVGRRGQGRVPGQRRLHRVVPPDVDQLHAEQRGLHAFHVQLLQPLGLLQHVGQLRG